MALRAQFQVGRTYIVGAISAGYDHALYLNPFGYIYAWGDDLFGQLGNGYNSDGVFSPTGVLNLSSVSQIAGPVTTPSLSKAQPPTFYLRGG